jgi:NTE family protein
MVVRRRFRLLPALVAGATLATAAAACRTASSSSFPLVGGRTCVVLSVGGFKGVSHAGALAELRRRGIAIDCVAGNSMGALVGALYATAPDDDPAARLRGYLAAYVAATEDEVGEGALLGALLGAVLTGGLGGALVGGAAGALTVDELDHDRAVAVLHAVVEGATITSTAVPFVTFYARRADDGLEIVPATDGDLAYAVGRSMANPLVFPDVNVRREVAAGIDPGGDRVAATPVEDACARFPGARLIAINVTREAAVYRGGLGCPVLEIRVPTPDLPADEIARGGPAFDQLVEAGRVATAAALDRAGL